ncbi:MAG TPA: quinone-dependent dihydroorotate dehydrogenase [Polyangiaceae bacterium]|nr:quinone-dependent dihydroorotate dehydrogenase [Polyangiaceae bacterium]
MYQSLLKPLFFRLPAEAAHQLAFGGLRALHALPGAKRLLRAAFPARASGLEVRALGLRFENPIVLAAGFDKQAAGYEALCSLGFGAVEVGTITGQPQSGNPKPRLFRLPADRALLNRMGFNNCGSERAAKRLRRPRADVVGVNIGKTKLVPDEKAVDDYVTSTERLGPLADYLVVNVSSPNTPGLRDLQAASRLRPLLAAVSTALDRVCPDDRPALLVKIAPDLADPEILAVADLALELGLDGIVATNTTIARTGLVTAAEAVTALGNGGVSGAPLRARALAVLRLLRSRVGTRLTLVAAGGIETVDDAWERLCAGASLIQIYTAFIYEGPALPSRLARGLLERAQREGFPTLQAALDHHHAERVANGVALSAS